MSGEVFETADTRNREWAAMWAGVAWLAMQDVYSRQQHAATQACVEAISRIRLQLDNVRIDVERLRKQVRNGRKP